MPRRRPVVAYTAVSATAHVLRQAQDERRLKLVEVSGKPMHKKFKVSRYATPMPNPQVREYKSVRRMRRLESRVVPWDDVLTGSREKNFIDDDNPVMQKARQEVVIIKNAAQQHAADIQNQTIGVLKDVEGKAQQEADSAYRNAEHHALKVLNRAEQEGARLTRQARKALVAIKSTAEEQAVEIINAAEEKVFRRKYGIDGSGQESGIHEMVSNQVAANRMVTNRMVTNQWRATTKNDFEKDTDYLQQIIMEGESDPKERQDFGNVFSSQKEWFDATVSTTTYFFDPNYNSVMRKKQSIDQLVKAQRKAEDSLIERTHAFDVSQEVYKKLRLMILYELNSAMRASDFPKGESQQNEIIGTIVQRVIDQGRLIRKVVAPKSPSIVEEQFPSATYPEEIYERKPQPQSVITEPERIKHLEERINQLETALQAMPDPSIHPAVAQTSYGGHSRAIGESGVKSRISPATLETQKKKTLETEVALSQSKQKVLYTTEKLTHAKTTIDSLKDRIIQLQAQAIDLTQKTEQERKQLHKNLEYQKAGIVQNRIGVARGEEERTHLKERLSQLQEELEMVREAARKAFEDIGNEHDQKLQDMGERHDEELNNVREQVEELEEEKDDRAVEFIKDQEALRKEIEETYNELQDKINALQNRNKKTSSVLSKRSFMPSEKRKRKELEAEIEIAREEEELARAEAEEQGAAKEQAPTQEELVRAFEEEMSRITKDFEKEFGTTLKF